MAKFSVCRIYKVTLWLNFSYNYSVNLLQILHLYIHPRNNNSIQEFLFFLYQEEWPHGKQAIEEIISLSWLVRTDKRVKGSN